MINPEDIKAGMTLGHADAELIRGALFKLAETEKRAPVAWTSQANLDILKSEPRKTLEFMSGDKSTYSNPVPLFTLPAPAINLAELVPDHALRELDGVIDWINGLPIPTNSATKWLIKMSDLRDAILRNIEEQSQ